MSGMLLLGVCQRQPLYNLQQDLLGCCVEYLHFLGCDVPSIQQLITMVHIHFACIKHKSNVFSYKKFLINTDFLEVHLCSLVIISLVIPKDNVLHTAPIQSDISSCNKKYRRMFYLWEQIQRDVMVAW